MGRGGHRGHPAVTVTLLLLSQGPAVGWGLDGELAGGQGSLKVGEVGI